MFRKRKKKSQSSNNHDSCTTMVEFMGGALDGRIESYLTSCLTHHVLYFHPVSKSYYALYVPVDCDSKWFYLFHSYVPSDVVC